MGNEDRSHVARPLARRIEGHERRADHLIGVRGPPDDDLGKPAVTARHCRRHGDRRHQEAETSNDKVSGDVRLGHAHSRLEKTERAQSRGLSAARSVLRGGNQFHLLQLFWACDNNVMDTHIAQVLEALRSALNKDIDSGTVSMIPPAALIHTLPMHEAEVQDTIKVWCFEHILRRRILGMRQQEIAGFAQSYLGLPDNVLDFLLSAMPLVVAAVNVGSDQQLATIVKDQRDAQLLQRFAAVTKEVYRKHEITTWTLPKDEQDASVPDGEMYNNSFSTNAPHVEASAGRVFRFDPEMRAVRRIMLSTLSIYSVALIGTILLFATGHYIWGTLLAIPVLLAAKFAWKFVCVLLMLPREIRQWYRNALLTPAVVVSLTPLRCLCTASLGNGGEEEYIGVRVLAMELPETEAKVGKVLPCVSVFTPGDFDDRWASFDPRPIEWGTDDPREIARCMQKLDADDKKHLQEAYRRYNAGEFRDEKVLTWVLDGAGTIVDTVGTSAGSAGNEGAQG